MEELAGTGRIHHYRFRRAAHALDVIEDARVPGATAVLAWPLVLLAFATAVYTALLFAQAKGRDFWQSPALPLHMLAHAAIGGAAASVPGFVPRWRTRAFEGVTKRGRSGPGVLVALVVMWVELGTRHPTRDSERAAKMIYAGRYKKLFWGVSVGLGSDTTAGPDRDRRTDCRRRSGGSGPGWCPCDRARVGRGPAAHPARVSGVRMTEARREEGV